MLNYFHGTKTTLKTFIACLFLFISNITNALNPIVPEDVLSPDELQNIIDEQNFFLYQETNLSSPIWRGKNRKYSNHFLYDRTYYLDLDEVKRRFLSDSFPLQYKLEEIFRAKMKVHEQYGQVIPKINLNKTMVKQAS